MMTAQQKQQILELRRQGFGYGTIAKKVKMNKSTVSTFCNRNGLGGVASEKKLEDPSKAAPVIVKKKGFPQNRGIVCTVKVTFEPWKPKAV